jgi:hypothetical protein
MLIVTAPAIRANSPASSSALTIAGEAPAASSTLAEMLMATSFVMHCTNGFFLRIALRSAPQEGEMVI